MGELPNDRRPSPVLTTTATQTRKPPATTRMLERLLTDEDWRVRHEAVLVLPSLKKPLPAKLLTIPLDDTERQVRETFVRTLRQCRGMPHLAIYKRALTDKDWHVRLAATEELALFGRRVPLDLLEIPMRDEEPQVRVAATRALRQREIDARHAAKERKEAASRSSSNLRGIYAVTRKIAAVLGGIGTFLMGLSQAWPIFTKIVTRIFHDLHPFSGH